MRGGKDEPFSSADKRDALLKIKSRQLLAAFKRKFPAIQFAIEHTWAGTFAETSDGLPFMDSPPKLPNVFFALGYGGNGVFVYPVTTKHKQVYPYGKVFKTDKKLFAPTFKINHLWALQPLNIQFAVTSYLQYFLSIKRLNGFF